MWYVRRLFMLRAEKNFGRFFSFSLIVVVVVFGSIEIRNATFIRSNEMLSLARSVVVVPTPMALALVVCYAQLQLNIFRSGQTSFLSLFVAQHSPMAGCAIALFSSQRIDIECTVWSISHSTIAP